MKKPKTINIREVGDIHADFHWTDFSVTLVFCTLTHKVRVHLPFYFLPYLAQKVHKLVRAGQAQIDQVKHSLAGD